MTRTDRALDFRVLARWFAETPTDADAHRLYRAAFGLSPSRHLSIDADSLERREREPISPQTSWLDAPPLLISPRLRATGRHERRGRINSITDRTLEREALAKIEALEAEQWALAQARLATGRRMRLSDLGLLESSELTLLLDLLGEALTSKVLATDTVETVSTDGALRISLEPVGDGAEVVLRTTQGDLRGPDHFITIRSTADEFASSTNEGAS